MKIRFAGIDKEMVRLRSVMNISPKNPETLFRKVI
jgi:hypothetical protein